METLITDPAASISMCAAALFFLTALLTGSWKYFEIRRSPKAEAPYYVNIAHRAALMYSFAAMMIAIFAGLSVFPDRVNIAAVLGLLFYFSLAIGRYIYLGIRNETENQHLNPASSTGELVFLLSLMVAEIGGFLVLVAGFLLHIIQVQ